MSRCTRSRAEIRRTVESSFGTVATSGGLSLKLDFIIASVPRGSFTAVSDGTSMKTW